jgi:molybdopterin-containing oxidoreductase family molybdopterin binding subunit
MKSIKNTDIYEDKWVASTCVMCYSGCSIRVHVVNGVAVQILGSPSSPNGAEGGLCAKGVSGIQLLYDPNRRNVPLRRTNPEKGLHADPKWKEITWEEALDEIVERLRKIREDDPGKLMIAGTNVHGKIWHAAWAFNAAFSTPKGKPNSGGTGGGLHCGGGSHAVTHLYYGSWSAAPDFKHCNYAIFWGASKGTAAGHEAALTMKMHADARARGMKSVAFDPMCHQSGGKATEWVPLIPGTDGAIAISMINVLLNESCIYDAEFLKKKTNGPYLIRPDGRYLRDRETNKPMVWDTEDASAKLFNDASIKDYALEGSYEVDGIECQPSFQLLKEHVKKYTPEMAAEVSTVPAETIRRIAREFGEAASIGSTIEIDGKLLPLRPVSSVIFRGGEGHTNSMHTCLATHMLNMIVGAAEVPGGTLGLGPGRLMGYPSTGGLQITVEADEDGFLFLPSWSTGGTHYPDPELPCKTLGLKELFPMWAFSPLPMATDSEQLYRKTGMNFQVDMAIIHGANPIISCADWDAMEKLYKNIPFIFSFNILPTELDEGFTDIVLPDVCYLEAPVWWHGINPKFHAPPSMQDWSWTIGQPAVAPQYQRRFALDVIFDICERLGIRKGLNEALNKQYQLTGKYALKADEKVDMEQVGDRALKQRFGKEYDWEWFKQHGLIRWPKQVEEAYWRWLTDIRVPIYFEWMADLGKKIREKAESVDIHVDWEQYTPLVNWYATPPINEKNPEYDLYCFSYRDILHTGSMTMEQPWLDETSHMNPYTYSITMNFDTATAKGLKDGDSIWVENAAGRKQKGRLKLLEGQHPQTIAIAACSGHWIDALPIAKGKGTNFDDLMPIDLKHVDPVSGNLEVSVKVKVYPANNGEI